MPKQPPPPVVQQQQQQQPVQPAAGSLFDQSPSNNLFGRPNSQPQQPHWPMSSPSPTAGLNPSRNATSSPSTGWTANWNDKNGSNNTAQNPFTRQQPQQQQQPAQPQQPLNTSPWPTTSPSTVSSGWGSQSQQQPQLQQPQLQQPQLQQQFNPDPFSTSNMQFPSGNFIRL